MQFQRKHLCYISLLNGGQLLKKREREREREREKIAPLEPNYFLKELTLFLKVFIFQGRNQPQKLFPFVNMVEKYEKVPKDLNDEKIDRSINRAPDKREYSG